MTKIGRPTDERKDKTIQFRCTEATLEKLDSLRNAFGMNRTELFEHLLDYYPRLAARERELLDERKACNE